MQHGVQDTGTSGGVRIVGFEEESRVTNNRQGGFGKTLEGEEGTPGSLKGAEMVAREHFRWGRFGSVGAAGTTGGFGFLGSGQVTSGPIGSSRF